MEHKPEHIIVYAFRLMFRQVAQVGKLTRKDRMAKLVSKTVTAMQQMVYITDRCRFIGNELLKEFQDKDNVADFLRPDTFIGSHRAADKDSKRIFQKKRT